MQVNRAAVRTKSAVSACPCALGLHAHAHAEWLTRLGSTPRGGGKNLEMPGFRNGEIGNRK